jgi:hypothetical protein
MKLHRYADVRMIPTGVYQHSLVVQHMRMLIYCITNLAVEQNGYLLTCELSHTRQNAFAQDSVWLYSHLENLALKPRPRHPGLEQVACTRLSLMTNSDRARPAIGSRRLHLVYICDETFLNAGHI